MKMVPMTMLNQHPSEVAKLVEAGEIVQVTRHGRAVLRLVPEPTPADPLGPLIAAGLITPPTAPRRAPTTTRPVRSKDDVDQAIAWLSQDAHA